MKKILVLSSVLFSSLILSSCGGECKEGTNTNVEVNKKFALTLSAQNGSRIELSSSKEANDNKYEAGSQISFKVILEKDSLELNGVTYNDISLSLNKENTYSFTMPNKDTTIKTTLTSLGDDSITTITPMEATNIPTTITKYLEGLQASSLVEGKYFKEADYSFNTTESSTETSSIHVEAGVNGVIKATGNTRYSNDSTYSKYLEEERGIFEDNYYYEIEKSTDIGTSTGQGAVTTNVNVLDIVEDDVESVDTKTQIKKSEAKSKSSSYLFSNLLIDNYFKASESSSFLNSSTSYGWKEIAIKSKLNDDKKSYTSTLTAVDQGYTAYDMMELKTVIDGDGFLSSSIFNKVSYDIDDFDTTENVIKEGANPIDTSVEEIVLSRGYKKTITEVSNLNNYVMKDYDLLTSYKIEDGEYVNSTEGKVENTSELKFQFVSKDNNSYTVGPRFKGCKEEGFIEVESGKIKVIKEGTFHLMFDNGLGEIKEFELTSVKPIPSAIEVSGLGDSIFLNTTKKVTVSVLPTLASQEVELKVSRTSEGSVEINKNEDETYSIKGTKKGVASITIKSIGKPELTKTIELNVVDKPDINAIFESLKTKTLRFKNSYDVYLVNFIDETTGQFISGTDDWGTISYGGVVGFNYTLDKENIVFTIGKNDGSSDGTTFVGFSIVNATTFTGTFSYYNSNKDVTMSLVDREDLSKLG